MPIRVCTSCIIDGSAGKQIKAELWNGIEKFIGLKNIEKKETEEGKRSVWTAYATSLGQDSDSDEG